MLGDMSDYSKYRETMKKYNCRCHLEPIGDEERISLLEDRIDELKEENKRLESMLGLALYLLGVRG